jgi:transglutaminase-like putative cysteine protease
MAMHPRFGTKVKQLELDTPKTYHLPNWHNLGDRGKLKLMREIVETYGRDPRVATFTISLLKKSGVPPRKYKEQAAYLLKWVQDNIYYVNEPGERLQDPLYTLKVGYGDCDDLSILLCSMFEALRLPWKFVISGKDDYGHTIRYVEKELHFPKAAYSHVYCCVGNNPFKPTEWYFCEPTLSVPLGWDVVEAKRRSGKDALPELGAFGSTAIVAGTIGGSVGEAAAKSRTLTFKKFAKEIGFAVAVGSFTAIGTEILLDFIKSFDWYRKVMRKK